MRVYVMGYVCRILLVTFAAAYLFALAILIIGTYGLFGEASSLLSAVYLLLLGWPWTLMVEVFPEPLWPWLAAVAPAMNLLVLFGICRVASSK